MKTKRKGLKPFIIKKNITNRNTKAIKCYLNEMRCNSTQVMSHEQELECFKKFKEQGCQESKQKIITANVRFVVSVAKEYHSGNPCLELCDLISTGNIGLMVAVEKFDYEMGFKFISFAVWWIRQKIIESILSQSNAIRIPGNARLNHSRQEKFISSFLNENGYYPTEQQIAEEIGTSENNIRHLNRCNYTKSLDAPMRDKDDSFSLKDTIKSQYSEMSELANAELKECLILIMKNLNPKEVKVLTGFFGLDGAANKRSLESLADEMKFTTERIRQIKATALLKIRKYITKHNIDLIEYL